MGSGPVRDVVINEFKNELKLFDEQIDKSFDQGYHRVLHQVTLFGHGALRTVINSIEYYGPKISLAMRKPVQGVDELTNCIIYELDEEKLIDWCNAVLYRTSLGETCSENEWIFSKTFPSSLRSFYPNTDQKLFNNNNNNNNSIQFILIRFN
ncbi:unnamed protein product [Adineta ricciae]|uniref:Uncharacterized protein n=1 Tax=Adineta ricciae TaxID=249248 RepID=A0A814Z9G7_ADIRI|nr:unnamed protein product [Adineta ricciae]